MEMEYSDVIESLKSLTDLKYKEFNDRISQTKLMTYGVRTPLLRHLAKTIKKEYPGFVEDFFKRTEYSYDEVMLCGWQIDNSMTIDSILKRLIPRMDCWAHTDQIIMNFDLPDAINVIKQFAYLKDGSEFEKRAYIILMFHNLMSPEYFDFIIDEIKTIRQGEYYVDMALAWLVCEIAVNDFAVADEIFKSGTLSLFVATNAAKKCRESFRISAFNKIYLARYMEKKPRGSYVAKKNKENAKNKDE